MLELYTLIELSRMMSASMDLDQLLTSTLKTVAATTQVGGYCLFLLNEATNRLAVRSADGQGTEPLENLELAPGEGLAGKVFQARNAEAHSGQGPFGWPDVPTEARSVLAVPLTSREKDIGVLMFFSPTPSAFSEREVAFFTVVADQLTIAVENASLYQKTRELSYRDGLTGLFNRRYFEEALGQELHRAERYRMPLSLIMADIDHFKRYNDTHGHPTGDQALKAVASILTETTRRADVVARYGGEELVLILPLTPKDSALLVAEKLRGAIENAAFPEGRLTISLGVATYPKDGTSSPDLIKAADDALYQAKQAGRNRVVVASPPA
jgi:diguanylate cyclase (GGDEF)-like protein